MADPNQRTIHEQHVFGVKLDAESRCGHWNSPLDIIAIRFKCCGDWFACSECHCELVSHSATVWEASERWQTGAMCGHCGLQMSIDGYLSCDSKCPACDANFNPRCRYHDHLYFDVRDA